MMTVLARPRNMIEIDGSYGEGGGQIVRTAVALSAVTGMPVCIRRIRQGRPKPGLALQHVRAITTLADICSAKTSGIEPGSMQITFAPGKIRGGSYSVEIGTAGSVTLLMQCLLPALLKADGPIVWMCMEAQMFDGLQRWTISGMYFCLRSDASASKQPSISGREGTIPEAKA